MAYIDELQRYYRTFGKNTRDTLYNVVHVPRHLYARVRGNNFKNLKNLVEKGGLTKLRVVGDTDIDKNYLRKEGHVPVLLTGDKACIEAATTMLKDLIAKHEREHQYANLAGRRRKIAPEHGLTPLDQPSEIRTKCDEEAQEMVTRLSQTMFHNRKKNQNVMELISGLTSLMLQVRTFSEKELNSFEFKSLQDTLKDIKKKLDGNSINSFKNNVDIHINHIQSGLSQMGNLHAFSATTFNV